MYAERPTNSIASIEADFNFLFFTMVGSQMSGVPGSGSQT